MEKDVYRKNIYDVIYLTACLFNNEIPDTNKVSEINTEGIYYAARAHSILGLTAYALENAGIIDEKFKSEKARIIRKIILTDIERQEILDEFEKNNIWYLPLKGIIIKNYYPKIGMRDMCDNDILYDDAAMDNVKEIMLKRGYTVKGRYGVGHDNEYVKPPFFNFEMHHRLFDEADVDKNILSYYDLIENKFVCDDGMRRDFSKEDHYIYIIAHEYKHYYNGGIGLRALIDTFIYYNHFNDRLNIDYISNELMKLGINDYEKMQRELSYKIFGSSEGIYCLSKKEINALERFVYSGTYGNKEIWIKNRISQSDYCDYIKKRINLNDDYLKAYHPFFYKHKILRPILTTIRLVKAATIRRKDVLTEIKILKENIRKEKK